MSSKRTPRPRAIPTPRLLRSFKNELKQVESKTERQWLREGNNEIVRLVREMLTRVPAYRSLAKKKGTNVRSIRSIADIKKLPLVDKDSYLRAYPIEKLCWNGEFSSNAQTIYATSGSTGEPFYFPHSRIQDEQYALYAELYLRANFSIDRKSTLYINAFPLGAWIGGIFTVKAISIVAERGKYPLSIINPGIHKEEIIKAIKRFGSDFDQIIIGSYGPFLKDVLDDGTRAGLKWKRYNLGFIFAAEGFSEGFRDYVLDISGAKNTFTATVNQYGTVDLGTMSFETPLSILIRRIAVENPSVYAALFKDSIKLPTLTQYMPQLFYFEEVDGSLLCSAWSGIPLARYDLKDSGGVYTFSELKNKLRSCGIDLVAEAKKAKVPIWKMPFVYVYERKDFSVSFYAFQIHPATIRRALENKQIRSKLTGKFTMLVKHDWRQNPYIEINVEMKAKIKQTLTLKRTIQKTITEQLLKESSEYRETWKHKGKKIQPRVVCWSYGHTRYFKSGTKQQWVKK